jgi:NAD(P)-dependent dehydrogenase (short-subunit alcohol dehydrogenase family)
VSPSDDMTGQVALVTGASGGIGSALVESFRTLGATVVGFDMAPPATEENGWVEGDVGSETDVKRAVKQVVDSHGRLDHLVHCAGVTRDGVIWKMDAADWDLVQQVNLRSAFLLLREVIPVMRARDGGRVVLLGSINGSRGKFGQTAYAASKAGLIGLAKSAAREAGRFGIRVNVVEPGMVKTAMTEKLPEKIRKAALDEAALGTMVETGDIARAVLFLCGQGGAAVTGQVLRVDGGQYM